MSQEHARGSASLGAMTADDLHKALGAARDVYKIERWWKYGQPAFDRVSAVLNVTNPGNAGAVIGSLIKLQDAQHQIGLGVFPYGLPAVDGVRIEVNIDQVAGK